MSLVLAQSVVKPKRPIAGDLVGFISPASPPYYIYNGSTYQTHVQDTMKALGLRVKFSTNSFVEYGYLAGTDEQRASDFMEMITDPDVKMIVANRGGWGCDRMVDLLDFDVIKANPKVIMGYSDLTTLLNSIYHLTNIITFHGPMGIDDWNNINSQYVNEVILKGQAVSYNVPDKNWTTITGGKARGKLVGGNVSVFTSMIGSKYLPTDYTGVILFFEDVDEQPYSMDRYFTQMHLAGVFDNIAGVVFGRCVSCQASKPSQSFTLEQVLVQKFKNLNVPCFYGAVFGHMGAQITLPVGIHVELDADEGTITMLESAVA